MAHLVHKETLRNQKVREKYIGNHNDLRRAKDAGIIDVHYYDEAKKQTPANYIPREDVEPYFGRASWPTRTDSIRPIQSSSPTRSMPLIPTPSPTRTTTKVKKGTIFDRNNFPLRLYKTDVRAEEQREAKNLQRKTRVETEYQNNEAYPDVFSNHNNGKIKRYWGSIGGSSTSSARSSAGKHSVKADDRFGVFPKHHRSLEGSVPRNIPSMRLLARSFSESINAHPNAPVFSAEPARSESISSSSHSQKASTTITTAFNSSATSALAVKEMPTWADRIIFGVTTDNLISPRVEIPRRHSCASERPSVATSQHSRRRSSYGRSSTESPCPLDGEPGLPYGLTNGYKESHYTPPSMLLLDLFASLLVKFEITTRIFQYTKGEGHSSSCSASLADSDSRALYHLGQFVTFDDETRNMKAVVEEQIWFLMAVKWLYFDRVLFSPGHHLCRISTASDGEGRRSCPQTGDQLRVLDLDGPELADWSWHAAHEYPEATIFVTTTSEPPSPFTPEHMAPRNHRLLHLPGGHSSSLPLDTNSINIISSRNLPSFLSKDTWLPLFRECHRVLKPDGYLELTVLDPVLNNMGPLLRDWILDHILVPSHPRTVDIMPTKTVLKALHGAGFTHLNKVWMWMPPSCGVGDELSNVTSCIGRFLFDELYCSRRQEHSRGEVSPHVQCEVWSDKAIIEECDRMNTTFRWLKVWAQKKDMEEKAE